MPRFWTGTLFPASSLLVTGVVTLAGASVFGSDAAPPIPPTPPGEIFGYVELVPGVRLANCRVWVEGTPLGAVCDNDGNFVVRQLPPGRWPLKVVAQVAGTEINRRFAAAANAEEVTDVGAVAMSPLSTVAGRVRGVTAETYGEYFVVAPSVGLIFALSPNGTYIISGMPAVPQTIEVRMFTQHTVNAPRRRTSVTVTAGQGRITIAEDLDVTARSLGDIDRTRVTDPKQPPSPPGRTDR